MTRTEVILHGPLGRAFGRHHTVYLSTNMPEEIMSFLRTQIAGFAGYMMRSHDRGIGYKVYANDRQLDDEGMVAPVGGGVFRIAPMVMGGKNGGVFNIILGAVLLVVSYFVPVLAPYLVPTAIGLISGGIMQLLSPVPKGVGSRDSPSNAASYSFNGPVNTQAQGNPVPVLIGRMIVGSAVISAGITTDDTVYVPTIPGHGTMGSGGIGG